MSAVCPEGHRSESTDYCDTCGAPIGASSGPEAGSGAQGMPHSSPSPSPASPEPAAEPLTCPHCGGLNVQDALFCEECGYDFTTGTPPMGSAAAATDEGDEDVEAVVEDEPADERPVEEDPVEEDPAEEEPVEEEPVAEEPAGGPEPEPEPEPEQPKPEPEITEPEPTPAPVSASTKGKPRHTPPSRALSKTWVVELWVDPDWYAVQQTDEACPSAGLPDIVLLHRSTALVGRPSGSLGVRPEVDAGSDSAVSRRHAQLSSDGQRWWIEDLGSSNGTFVGTVGEPLPQAPIPPGQRVELDLHDRIYVGAWTRMVLRPATASEEQGQG